MDQFMIAYDEICTDKKDKIFRKKMDVVKKIVLDTDYIYNNIVLFISKVKEYVDVGEDNYAESMNLLDESFDIYFNILNDIKEKM